MAIIPSTPGEVSPPNTLTPDAAGAISVPNTLTADAVGSIAVPNALAAEAAGTIAIPNTLTPDAAGSIAIPNTLSPESAGAVLVPNVLSASATSALPRVLCPIMGINFIDGIYTQCGQSVLFDDLFTYTRSSLGTFINRVAKCSGGYDYFVDTAANDVLRIEYSQETGENLGALLEDASTNLALSSEDLSNATYWTQTVSTNVPNALAAPDNAITATKCIPNIGEANGQVRQVVTISDGAIITLSAYAQAGEQSTLKLLINTGLIFESAVFDLITGVVTSSTAGATGKIKRVGDYFRCEVTADVDATYTTSLCIIEFSGPSVGDGVEGVYIWGAQVEELPFASSYIKTVTSSITRAADSLTADGSNMPALNQNNSITATIDTIGVNNINQHAFEVGGGDSFERQISYFNGDSTSLLNYVSGTNVPLTVDDQLNVQSIASVYDGGLVSGYINGDLNNSVTVPYAETLIIPTILYIGRRVGIIRSLYGHIKKLSTFDLALTASEVKLS